MALLDKVSLLATEDVKTEEVEIPEWGGSVRIRVMNGHDRDEFDKWMYGKETNGAFCGMRVFLCYLCVIDKDGKRMFSMEDLPALEEKSGSALSTLFIAIQKLNKLTRAEVDKIAGN